MAVYTAYSDESGVGDPSGEFLVGGYLTTETLWSEIVPAWRNRVLNGPPKIPMFHVTDMRRGKWRERKGISYNDSECRIAEAIRIIDSTGALDAVASVVKRSILQEVFPKQSKSNAGLDKPDYVCYMAYIQLVLLRVKKLHPDATRANFVFARKNETLEGMKNVIKATRLFLATEEPEVAGLFGDCATGEMEANIPLQFADLLCWHIQCYYRGRFARTEENRMWRLLKERDGDLHEWSKGELEVFAAALGGPNTPSHPLT